MKQYAYACGPSTSVPMPRKAVVPSTDIVNGYVETGILTLPLWDLPPGNTDAYFVVTVLSSEWGGPVQRRHHDRHAGADLFHQHARHRVRQ